jgi:hypothetical protein
VISGLFAASDVKLVAQRFSGLFPRRQRNPAAGTR